MQHEQLEQLTWDHVEELHPDFWVFDDHRWAFYAWETARVRRPTTDRYSIVHIDHHYDGCSDIRDVTGLTSLSGLCKVRELVESNTIIRKDSFIAPAVLRGYVSVVHFLCQQNDNAPGLHYGSVLKPGNCAQFLHESMSSLMKANIPDPLLFDFCLDFFNRSELWGEGDLWSEAEIGECLSLLEPLVRRADVVTCSLSFGYSGSEEDTRRLAKFCIPRLLAMRGAYRI
jgi:hypothetical protein